MTTQQPPRSKSRIAIFTAGALTLTGFGGAVATFVSKEEGTRNRAYRDIVGVATICTGETAGVKMGDYKTDAECRAMLGESLVKHETGMRKCLKDPDKLADGPYLASLSVTYNIGIGGFCKSTAAKRFNAGDIAGGCKALTWFNRAGGREVRGLTMRREREYKVCIAGIK